MLPPTNTRVWIVAGVTDMRCGFDGLAAKVQMHIAGRSVLRSCVVFRGRRGDRIKVLWFDGDGMCVVLQALGGGPLRMASGRERARGVDGGPVVDAARRHRLAQPAPHGPDVGRVIRKLRG